ATGLDSGTSGPTGQQGAVWTSTDGLAWRASLLPDGGDSIHGVVASGTGFVAVGNGQPSDYQSGGAVWTSPDGNVWTRRSDDPLFLDTVLSGVMPGPGGLLAVG